MGDCKKKAFDLVARRPHFERELARKLQERGFSGEEVATVLADLTRLGLLDDSQNARDMVAGPLTRKGFGPRRMRLELRRRGVAESVAEAAVGEVFEDPEEELRRARDVAERRASTQPGDEDRLARQLDRKGYSKAVILRVLGDLEFD